MSRGQRVGSDRIASHVRLQMRDATKPRKFVVRSRNDSYLRSTGKQLFDDSESNAVATADDDVVFLAHSILARKTY